jgi:hypothetical protein
MKTFEIIKYSKEHFDIWNNFVAKSKNGTFLFHRDFMDYHQDRFDDYSLLIFKKEKLIAIFPANKSGEILYSHQGLSYGGLVFTKNARFEEELEAFKAVLGFIKSNGFLSLNIKILPKIYHSYPSDAIDYFLFLLDAKLVKRDVSSTIEYGNRLRIQSNRLEGKKKAEKLNLNICEEQNFKAFWDEILIPNLEERYQTKPVHSLSEIEMLNSSFPKNIRQFNVYENNKIVAGTTIFETDCVVHVQYISANNNRQKLGSLDFLFEHLINTVFKHKKYFDFGISNENQGQNINQGLLSWKEGFGARSIVYDCYEIDLSQSYHLKSVLI